MEYTTIDNMHISKLTLGTAQLGPSYGIANVTGKPDCKESKEILKVAANHGINCFDTAPSYGNSESIIGSFLSSYHNFSKVPVIVTKLPPINIDGKVTFSNVYPLVQKHVIESIKQLQIKRIPIYLLHRASDIDACEGLIIESLLELKKEGLIGILGVSTYTPEEVESTLKLDVIKAIQIPVNIFDHRLIKTGLLGQLKDKDFIVFGYF